MSDLQNFPSHLLKRLQEREQNDALRALTVVQGVDFCSNDYLGFARSHDLRKSIDEQYNTKKNLLLGSTGSRLITGHSLLFEQTERYVANFHKAEEGLLFNSGYDANTGLFSCIALRGDTILYDELIHASVRDGVRLSLANSFKFEHNNVPALEQKLKAAKGNIFVAIESVYSMDGDIAPLEEITNLCEKYKAHLIVDEAHATGVIGPHGVGLVVSLNLQDKVFARVHTFGKALGCFGAIVLGSAELKKYLINFSRSFIFTTALPAYNLVAIKCAYDKLSNSETEIGVLNENITLYANKLKGKCVVNKTPIQTVLIPGNEQVKQVADIFQKQNFNVKPILSPTVPLGKERIRICLHTFNTKQEVEALTDILLKLV